MVLDDEKVAPLRFSQTAIFESRLGSLTLIQLGAAQVLTHTLTHPLECRLRPRFTVLAHVGEPYWRRPTTVMAEVGGLTAWMHDGRATRSGSLNSDERDGGVQDWSLTFRDFGDQVFRFDESSLTVTIRSLKEINHTDSRDELTVRFRTVVIAERSDESTWTQKKILSMRSKSSLVFCLGPTSSGAIYTVNLGCLRRLTKPTGTVSIFRRRQKFQNPGSGPSPHGRMTTPKRRPKNSRS